MNFKQLITEIYNHLDDYEEVQNPVDYIRENVNVYIIGDDTENFYFKKKGCHKELTKVPDVIFCGDKDLKGNTIYCDDCSQDTKPFGCKDASGLIHLRHESDTCQFTDGKMVMEERDKSPDILSHLKQRGYIETTPDKYGKHKGEKIIHWDNDKPHSKQHHYIKIDCQEVRKENFNIELHQLKLKYNDIIKCLGVEYKEKEKEE